MEENTFLLKPGICFNRVEILFDTSQDLRSGDLFKVSVRNIQEDAASSESRRGGTNSDRSTVTAASDIHEKSWNAVWQSATSRFEEGWTAEIAISLTEKTACSISGMQ